MTSGRSHNAIMSAAQDLADDATRDISALIQSSVRRDPLDDLVDRVRPVVTGAIDALQVAASLEADGLTDRTAQVEYGYPDVFNLAEEVYRRTGAGRSGVAPIPRITRSLRSGLHDIAHGLLYMLPAAIFPALLTAVGPRSLVLGLVLAGGLGWVWAGCASWLAYRLLGRGHPAAAGRMLRWWSLAGLPAAAAVGFGVTGLTGAGRGLVALAVGQMAYQMAANTLMFYHREYRLLVVMGPAVAVGLAYLYYGAALLEVAVAVSVASVALAYALAMRQTVRPRGDREAGVASGLRGEWWQFPSVLLYTALTAAFLLHAQAPYMSGRLDIVVAALPLVVGMGVVEWRARRFGEQARALLGRVRQPRRFVVRVWLLLAGGLAACLVTITAVAAVVLLALRAAGLLSAAAAVMAAAAVVLGGAYFLGFLLANLSEYRWLCGSLAVCLGTHVAVALLAPRALSPLADTTVFLATAVLLLLLFVAALVGRLGHARDYR
jgi:hypothetical protein